MKALTVCQPYAALIASGEKRVENRPWPTAYRGPLAIHAGKNRKYLRADDDTTDMVFGAIVAVATLEACFEYRRRESFVLEFPHYEWVLDHEHTEGPWCWILGDVGHLVEPLPCRGQLGLFDVPFEWHPHEPGK